MRKISADFVFRILRSRLGAPMWEAGLLVAMILPVTSICAAPAVSGVINLSSFAADGMVVSPNGETLYVAATGAIPSFFSELIVINTQFNTITAELPLFNQNVPGLMERGALQVITNKQGTLIFVVNIISGTVDVIDATTNTEIQTFEHNVIGPDPIGVAISPDGKELWVANSGTPPAFNNGTVQVVNVNFASRKFGQAISLINTGGSPNTIAFNKRGSLVYVLNGGNAGFVDEINVSNFKIIRNNIGAKNGNVLNFPNPLAMAMTKDASTLYIADKFSDLNNVDIPGGVVDYRIFMFAFATPLPKKQLLGQVVLSPNQAVVYTANSKDGSIGVADRTTQLAEPPIVLPSGAKPYFLTFTPNGKTLYVSNSDNFNLHGGLPSISVITGF